MREWLAIYYDNCAEAVDTDLLHTEEPDVLMEVFLKLESNPEFVKVIVHHITKENKKADMPFAVLNKVIA